MQAGKTVATAEAAAQSDRGRWLGNFHRDRKARQPSAMVSRAPNLYSAIVTVESAGKARDAEQISFGVRTAVFDADKGFFLNGKSSRFKAPATIRTTPA
jgi:beta-galactosidase